MFSPFDVIDEHKSISETKTRQIFNEATSNALEVLRQPSFLALISSDKIESDLLTFFDCLMQDYIFSKFRIETDQFRAVMVSHQIHDVEESDESIFEAVCLELYSVCDSLKSRLPQ